eukprot:GILI01003362.1.p1 GENE.GILI01003362.1~~GILI01003362.1.p1  ORF type:complete len:665 (-),score=247.62 GILI01003362.1:230-2224(-)
MTILVTIVLEDASRALLKVHPNTSVSKIKELVGCSRDRNLFLGDKPLRNDNSLQNQGVRDGAVLRVEDAVDRLRYQNEHLKKILSDLLAESYDGNFSTRDFRDRVQVIISQHTAMSQHMEPVRNHVDNVTKLFHWTQDANAELAKGGAADRSSSHLSGDLKFLSGSPFLGLFARSVKDIPNPILAEADLETTLTAGISKDDKVSVVNVQEGLTEEQDVFFHALQRAPFATPGIERVVHKLQHLRADGEWDKAVDELMPLVESSKALLRKYPLDGNKVTEVLVKYVLEPVESFFSSDIQAMLAQYDKEWADRLKARAMLQAQIDELKKNKTPENLKAATKLQRKLDALCKPILDMIKVKRDAVGKGTDSPLLDKLHQAKAEGLALTKAVLEGMHLNNIPICEENLTKLNQLKEKLANMNSTRVKFVETKETEFKALKDKLDEEGVQNEEAFIKLLKAEASRRERLDRVVRDWEKIKAESNTEENAFAQKMSLWQGLFDKFVAIKDVHEKGVTLWQDNVTSFVTIAINYVEKFFQERTKKLLENRQGILKEYYDNYCQYFVFFHTQIMLRQKQMTDYEAMKLSIAKEEQEAVNRDDIFAMERLDKSKGEVENVITYCQNEIKRYESHLQEIADEDMKFTVDELNKNTGMFSSSLPYPETLKEGIKI